MRKLILGIIAVVFLQIAFFAYLAYKGPVDQEASIARNISREVAPPVNHSPITTPLPASPQPASPQRAGTEEVQTRPRTTPKITTRREVRASDERTVNQQISSVGRSRVTRDYVSVPVRDTRSVPAGHTMVLVDYLPAKFEKKPRAFVPKCGTTEYASVHRKRSFLNRTASVVKKPWKWMKSIASKLN